MNKLSVKDIYRHDENGKMKSYPANIFQRLKYVLLLLGILSFHVFMNYEVLGKSEICRTYDESNRISDGMLTYQTMFLSHYKIEDNIKKILQLSGQAHPPFVQIVQGVMVKLLTVTSKHFDENSIILATNGFFLFILLFSVYGIGAIIYNKNAGIFAAFLVSFFPMIYGQTRNMLLDFPLASMTSLSFYLLFKTNEFRSFNYSILLGIALGFSVLVKESFVSFVFFPFFYYFYESCKAHRIKRIILNFALALFFVIAVTGIIYLRPENFFAIKHYINKVFFLNLEKRKEIFYYFKDLLLYAGIFISVLIIPVMAGYFKNIKLQNRAIFLWFFASFIIFSLSPNKAPRFIIPILPALALMVAGGLFHSKLLPKVKKAYAYTLVLAAFLQYFIYFFNFSFINSWLCRMNNEKDFPPIVTYKNDNYYPAMLKLMQFFSKEKEKLNEKASKDKYDIVFLFMIGEIHCPMQYKVLFESLPFTIHCPEEGDEFEAPAPGTFNWPDFILHASYIVDKNGYDPKKGGDRENVAGMIREGFKKHEANFKKVYDIALFDGSHIYIYKNLKLE